MTLTALTSALKSDTVKIIGVNGDLTCSGDARAGGNTTIIGVGADSGLTGCGLNIRLNAVPEEAVAGFMWKNDRESMANQFISPTGPELRVRNDGRRGRDYRLPPNP